MQRSTVYGRPRVLVLALVVLATFGAASAEATPKSGPAKAKGGPAKAKGGARGHQSIPSSGAPGDVGVPRVAPRPAAPAARAPNKCGFRYGTYSISPKKGEGKMPVADRLQQIRELGADMVVAVGDKLKVLDALPPGMLAVPGCGLMKKKDWQDPDGHWSAAVARVHLARLAAKFANHPRVYGVCITHEVTEYADHARRRWMYQLAKEYFPRKKVIHYYGTIYDRLTPSGEKNYSYGLNGEVETDVFFVSLPAVGKDGRYMPEKAQRMEPILESAARTPGIPLWGQTSINADHKYVKGAESMYAIWGQHGENMSRWVESLLRYERLDAHGRPVRLNGFFWRSLGRFPYDLGYPPFSDHRTQMRVIAANLCPARARPAASAAADSPRPPKPPTIAAERNAGAHAGSAVGAP